MKKFNKKFAFLIFYLYLCKMEYYEKEYIYPDLDIRTGKLQRMDRDGEKVIEEHVVIQTKIRLKDENGEYYLIPFYKRYIIKDQESLIQLFKQCTTEIYNHLLLYKRNKNLIQPDGLPYELKDKFNQVDEKKRLMKKLNIFKENWDGAQGGT